MIMLVVMCIGASAGSTGGGFKVSRLILICKYAKKELHTLSHPRSVKVITFDGNRVSDETMRNTLAYLIIYVFIFCVSLLIVSFDKMDIVSNISGVVATLNNIGPGLSRVGPTGNFGDYSMISKFVFILDMLIGRLEIYPMIYLLIPSSRKKHFIK